MQKKIIEDIIQENYVMIDRKFQKEFYNNFAKNEKIV